MSTDESKHSAAERITMIISIVILAGILGLAGWSSMSSGTEPAIIEVRANLEQVRETEFGFYVPIVITNTGGMTGQDVVVTGELDLGDGQPEVGEVTIDFLSGGESERAELVFTTHPNEGEFTVGATSFVEP